MTAADDGTRLSDAETLGERLYIDDVLVDRGRMGRNVITARFTCGFIG